MSRRSERPLIPPGHLPSAMPTSRGQSRSLWRLLAKILRGIPPVLLGSAILLTVAWISIQIVNDHFRWSQYLFWFPSVTLLVPAAALWIAGTLLRTALGRPRSRLDWIAAVGCALMALHIALIDYRLHHLALPRNDGSAPAIRVLNWNVSGIFDADLALQPIFSHDADIVITVDACCHHEWARAARARDPDSAILFSRNLQLISRYRVLRHAQIDLGIPAPDPLTDEEEEERRISRQIRRLPLLRHTVPPDGFRARPDPGRAWYLELDTTEALGRTIIIWVIDLPSDLRLGRAALAAHAAAVIESWEGYESAIGLEGVQAVPARGFPTPDLIIGDFNIPRRSASLQPLTLNYTHAHTQAGRGHAGTYPRHRPLTHIDHTFVGPAFRARRYDIIDPGAGSHRMQLIEVAPR